MTNTGYLLIFPLQDLPQLQRGKGNKIIGIPASKLAERQEYVQQVVVLNTSSGLLLQAGKRTLKLLPNDWKHFCGERGRRGSKLPRGVERVERMEVFARTS